MSKKEYLEEMFDGLEESLDRVKTGELEGMDVIPEIKRVEGMCVFAHHFNMISALEYSYFIDKLSDMEYLVDL